MTTKVPYNNMSESTVNTEPRFKKCCFCFPIRTGCLILAYANLAAHVYQVLTSMALIALVALISDGHGLNDADSSKYYERNKPVIDNLTLFLYVFVGARLGVLIFDIICIVGVHKSRPILIRAYVIFSSIRLLFLSGVFFYLLFGDETLSNYAIFRYSLEIVLTGYFNIVYYAFACRLMQERKVKLEATISRAASDIAFVFPENLDKKVLIA